MSTDDTMTIDERRKYLRRMKKGYVKANRAERSKLLDDMMDMTELDRKTLIRAMHSDLKRKPRQRQRGHTYGPQVDDALRVIAETLDYICAERMTPQLVTVAQQLARHGELSLTPELLTQLSRISISTVRRRVQHLRQDEPTLPRHKPKPTHPLRRQVPMERIPWDQPHPGHFEVDLVHHCGPSASGEYVHTLQLIDVCTGWSERCALLGRSYRAMQAAFQCCLARLPFPVLELHPDNGSEFFNQHLLRFWAEALPNLHLSRSRPYHKNDNRFVEQKNSSLVRAYLGYDRLDTVAQTQTLNQLYDLMWLYHNFFQPVMRLNSKTLLTDAGHHQRIKRTYDQAQTPFDRLCATSAITTSERLRLESLRGQTNPRQLRRDIYALLDHLFNLPGAIPGVTEDIFETLDFPSLKDLL
jgi:hypothetical protein